MGFAEHERKRIEATLRPYCARKSPAHLRDRLRVGFRLEGLSAVLYESRPLFNDPSRWVETVVAKFRFTKSTGTWRLYWADRNSRWHRFEGAVESRTLDPLLRVVDKDPTGIFWG